MAQQVKLINSVDLGTLTRDVDFSAINKAVLENKGIVSGMQATQAGGAGTNITVPIGIALVPVQRTTTSPVENWDIVFTNTDDVVLSAGANKFLYIEITQLNLNDGTQNTDPNGTGIGEIKIGNALPTSNFIKLGSTDGAGLLEIDSRSLCSLNTATLGRSDFTTITSDIVTTGDISGNNGTFSGNVNISGDVDITGDYTSTNGNITLTNGKFSGDGSLLTNITAEVPSTQLIYTMGEDATAGLAMSLHSDGKLYIGGTNFVGILHEDKNAGQLGKVNCTYDNHQSGLTPGAYYGYNETTGVIEVGNDFKAISETELNLLEEINPIFGDASDGNLTISGTHNLIADTIYQYGKLIIGSGDILTTGGKGNIIIKCHLLELDGTIQAKSIGDAGNLYTQFGLLKGGKSGDGGLGGLYSNANGGIGGTCSIEQGGGGGGGGAYDNNSNIPYNGGNGGDGNTPGGVGGAGINYNDSVGGGGGDGGNSAGGGGAGTKRSNAGDGGNAFGNIGTVGTGYGSGGGGGAGGEGSGNIYICAKTISGSGSIISNGENGGNGGDGFADYYIGCGGGGGGGGGGGFILCVYKNSTFSGTLINNGGTGGTGGTNVGGGTNGVDGINGENGEQILNSITKL